VTLDLTRIVDQIDAMVRGVDRSQEGERFDALRTAWNELDELDVNTRFTKSRTSFLLARTDRNYRTRHRLPPLPTTYTVAATDGSMILPDRHSPARFYLLNVGKALLRYGDDPKADLTSEPDLRFAEDDLVITSDGRRTPVNEVILGLRCSHRIKALSTRSSANFWKRSGRSSSAICRSPPIFLLPARQT
jgi:hypothetical protein